MMNVCAAIGQGFETQRFCKGMSAFWNECVVQYSTDANPPPFCANELPCAHDNLTDSWWSCGGRCGQVIDRVQVGLSDLDLPGQERVESLKISIFLSHIVEILWVLT